MPSRVMIHTAGYRQSLSLDAGKTYTIGRSEDSDLRISDPIVSRIHAYVRINRSGVVQIRDAGSGNGTFSRGERVIGWAVWARGASVELGSNVLLFMDTRPTLRYEHIRSAATTGANTPLGRLRNALSSKVKG